MAIEIPSEFELNVTKNTEAYVKLFEEQEKKTTLDEKKREQTAKELIDENTQKLAKQAAAGIGYDNTKGLVTNLESMSRELLGKSSTPASSVDFDPSAVIGQLSSVTEQVNKLFQPLKSAVGSIPLLSPITEIVGTLTSALKLSEKHPSESNEELPDLSQSMKTAIVNTQTNIMTFMAQLPMIYIKLIFMMLQKILDLLLKIFDSLKIKISNIFPLNLIKNALELMPKLMDFVTDAPGQIKDASENIMRRMINASNELAQQECHVVDVEEQQRINDEKNKPTKEEEQSLIERYGDSMKLFLSSVEGKIDTVCKKAVEYDPIKRIFPHDPGPPEPKSTDDEQNDPQNPSVKNSSTTQSPPKTI